MNGMSWGMLAKTHIFRAGEPVFVGGEGGGLLDDSAP
jgi:hypothetical protein